MAATDQDRCLRQMKIGDDPEVAEEEEVSGGEGVLDGGVGWVVVLGAFLGQVVCGGITRSLSLVYAQFIDRFKASATATSWAFALFGLCKMFGSPLASFLANTFTHRVTVIIGSVVLATGFVVSAYVPELYAMYFTFSIVGGIGLSFGFTTTLAIAGLYFDKNKGKANALASLGSDVGAMGLPPLIQYVYKEHGFVASFILLGGVSLHMCISGSLYWPIRKHKAKLRTHTPLNKLQRRQDVLVIMGSTLSLGSTVTYESRHSLDKVFTELPHKTKDNRSPNGLLREAIKKKDGKEFEYEIRDVVDRKSPDKEETRTCVGSCNAHLLKDPVFIQFIVLLTAFFMCTQSSFSIIAGLCMENSFTLQQVSAVLVIAAGVCTPVKIIAGVLFDLPFVRRYEEASLGLLGTLAGLAVVCLPFLTGLVTLTTFWVLANCLLIVFYMHHVIVLTSLMGPQMITSALGLARPFLGVGELLGLLFGGLLRDYTGSYAWSYIIFGGIFALISVVYTVAAITRQCRHTDDPHLPSGPEIAVNCS